MNSVSKYQKVSYFCGEKIEMYQGVSVKEFFQKMKLLISQLLDHQIQK